MRNSLLKFGLPLAVLSAGLMMTSSLSYAKPEFTKKEKKPCTFCHVKAGKKDLNDAGKYYKDHNFSLEGYTPK